MWPFQPRNYNIVTLALTPQQIVCLWAKKNSEAVEVKAYERKKFGHLEFEKSMVFNPSKIGAIIDQFIKKNQIIKPFVSLAATGPYVFEKIITIPTSSPEKKDIQIKELKNHHSQHVYVGPSPKSGFNFYICGIKQPMLFQYKLLAIRSGFNLISLTTQKAAHIQLYKYLKKENFSHSQLAIDLSKSHYDTQSIIDKKRFLRTIDTNTLEINQEEEYPFLITNIGLFLLGNTI